MGSKPPATVSKARRPLMARALGDGLDLESFRHWFSDFPDPVIVTDLQCNVVFLNNSAQRLTGRSIDKDGPLVCMDILRTEHDDTRGSLIQQCLDARTLNAVQVHVKNGAARWVPFSLSAQMATERDGKPAGCIAIVRDAPADPTREKDLILGPIFSSVINNFPMPFFAVDTNLTVTYMNDHLEKLTGYRTSEVVGRMTCAELLKTARCHTENCTIKRAMETRVPIAGLRLIVSDREDRKIPVVVHTSVITDSENRVIGAFQVLRDITNTVEAEQKITMLLEITQEGILMVDENDRVIYANSKIAEILNQPQAGLVGRDVGEFLPSQHLTMMHDLVQKVDPENPQQLRFCTTIQPAENSQQEYRAFETCIVVSRVGKNIISCLYLHDLSKHIEIERQLYNAHSFLNNIIMNSPDGIVVVDTDGTILIFNEAAERILGYSADEVVGDSRALSKIYSPEQRKEIMRLMRSNEHGPPGKLTSSRITLVNKDGEEVPVNFSAAIIKKEDKEIGSVGIFSDLRERIKMSKELQEARIQLMQTEKIASIGRLAAGVAHEINNPLSGILVFADMLAKELANHPQWSEDLQVIIQQTLRCKQIVARLLDFSRQSVGQKLAFDINMVVDRSAEMLTHQAVFHDITFEMDLQPEIPEMTGDPGQLQQVFTNLILNAGTAMNGKGSISISSRFDLSNNQVILQFSDTGPGIPLDVIDKIFEPFFTTKKPGEGTGLGLSVAYGIIQQHGGSIGVKNSPSGGAVFTIMLPLECPEKAVEFTC